MELETYYPQIRRFVIRYARDSWDADDLAQETYCRAYQGLAKGAVLDNPEGWLFSIAKWVGVDSYRRRSVAFRLAHSASQPDGYQKSPEAAEQSESLVRLSAASRMLPESDRTLLDGFYVQNRSCEDLGRDYGTSQNTTKVRLYRARKKLLARLE